MVKLQEAENQIVIEFDWQRWCRRGPHSDKKPDCIAGLPQAPRTSIFRKERDETSPYDEVIE
jgi:hypothetical protein